MFSSKRRTRVNASTFHSWAMNLIRRNPKVFQMDSPTLIDRDDILTLLRRFRGEQKAKNPPKASELADFHSLMINIRGTAERAAELKRILPSDIQIYKLASAYYRNYKKLRNYIDYDDILECLADRLQQDQSQSPTDD